MFVCLFSFLFLSPLFFFLFFRFLFLFFFISFRYFLFFFFLIHRISKKFHIFIHRCLYQSRDSLLFFFSKKNVDWMIEHLYDLCIYIFSFSCYCILLKHLPLFYQHLFTILKTWWRFTKIFLHNKFITFGLLCFSIFSLLISVSVVFSFCNLYLHSESIYIVFYVHFLDT